MKKSTTTTGSLKAEILNLKPTVLLFTFYVLLSTFNLSAQNIGINGTGAIPNTSALLDIVSKDKGLLIPRVQLTSTTDATTITNGNVNSLLVYNTATITDVVPGYYYWDGSWITLVGPVGSTVAYYEVDATSNIAQAAGASNVDNMVITTTNAGIYRTEAVLDYTTTGATIVPSAIADNIALRAEIAGLAQTTTHAIAFLNETINPGVIDVVGAASLTGNMNYDAGGNPNAIFVIRATTTITASASTTFTLSGGAKACNIFWIAGTTVVLTGAANVAGTYLSGTTAAAAAGAVINGRLLALAGTIVLTTVANFTLPTGTTSLTMGVLNQFIVFSNLGAVTATAATAKNFTGDVGTGTAAGNTGWDGLNGNTYFGPAALGFIGSFVMAVDGNPIESTRINATGSSVSFPGKSLTTAAGGVISIMSDVTLGTMTTGNRNIFSLRLQ